MREEGQARSGIDRPTAADRLSVLLTNKKRGWSGETAYIYELAVRYRERGVRVCVATRAGSVLGERLAAAGVAVHDLHFDPRSGGPRRHLGDMAGLRRIARDAGVNVLHTNASWDTWLAQVAFRRRRDVLRVRTKHNVKPIRGHPLNRWLYRSLIQWLIAPSRNVEAHLRDSPVVRFDRVRLIPLGVALEPFIEAGRDRDAARAALAEEIGVPLERLGFVAAYISRVTARKNPGALVEAIRRLGPDSGVRAVFVGDGNLEELRERASGLPGVHVLGHRDAPARYHAAADAFVLASYDEPFGLAAVEAMATGTPAVLADAGGFREIIEHERSGLFFPIGRAPEGIAESLTRLRDDRALRERLSEHGRQVATARFSADGMVERTLAFYDAARGAGRPQA